MKREEKAREVEELADSLRGGPTTFILTGQGLTVNTMSDLRKQIRASSSRYRVVKNRLALRALKDTPLSPLAEHFRGPTAIAYSEGDAASLAKIIGDFARVNKNLRVKAGFVDGRILSAAETQALADLPPRPILMARFIGVLNAPMTRFINVLKGPARGLVRAMSEIARKKEPGAQKDSTEPAAQP
jgi:large subunit ribosomal protein L10